MSRFPYIKSTFVADQIRTMLHLSNVEIALKVGTTPKYVQMVRRREVSRVARPGSWNDERVEWLKKLWSDGLSASVVARRLGGFEHCPDGGRSAVIGKVHRLGLPGRATATRTQHPHRKRQLFSREGANARPNATMPAAPKRIDLVRSLYETPDGWAPPVDEIYIPPNERKTVATLTEFSCRWPIGDPQHPDFHFCGKRKIPGLPYCEVHARRAYQPPQARRRGQFLVVASKESVVA